MMTNTQLLAIAKKQLGNGGAKYRKYVGAGGNYCNMFVYWLFNANGCASLLPLPKANYARTYCPSSIKWCRKNLAEIPPYLAMAGDIIYMDWEPNGNPNHIGIVDHKISTDKIATIEGNTSGKKNGKAVSGIVAAKTRNTKYTNVFRPHFKATYKLQRLTVDSDCGYNTIASLQKILGVSVNGILNRETVMKIQGNLGCKKDAAWGPATSRAFQKFLNKSGFKCSVDGEFGPGSVRAMQTWLNARLYSKTTASKPAASKPAPKPATPKPAAKPKATLKSRRIEIDLTNQIATVYGVYSDGTSKPIMSEFVSTAGKGHTTPTGNFKIQGASGGRKAKYRTAKMSSGKSYAEYLCRFHGGKCMHGVPYSKRNTSGMVYKGEFNKLGTPRSAGCVRMPIKMARYIYNNCPVGTPVIVLKGKKGDYPMGKPKKYTATKNLDPTK